MWLVRLILFAAGAFVGCEVLFVACLECEVCVRTFHPTLCTAGAIGALVIGILYRFEMRAGYSIPDASPTLDSAVLATGVWSPFALQALLAALL